MKKAFAVLAFGWLLASCAKPPTPSPHEAAITQTEVRKSIEAQDSSYELVGQVWLSRFQFVYTVRTPVRGGWLYVSVSEDKSGTSTAVAQTFIADDTAKQQQIERWNNNSTNP